MQAECGADGVGAGFVQVRRDFIRCRNLSAKAKLIGILLATYADASGVAFLGLARLQRESGLGRDATKAARAELVRGGYIEIRQAAQGGRFGRVNYAVTDKIIVRAKKGAEPAVYRRPEKPEDGKTGGRKFSP